MADAQRWINTTSHRQYEVRVLHNLFGQWEVQRAWDSVGSAFGAMRHDPQVSRSDCWKLCRPSRSAGQHTEYQYSPKKFI
jgi:hypothetical protein